jgi:Activator of Hsp90 ATPase homolog 1-like protein
MGPHFSRRIPSTKSPQEVFAILQDVNQWWTGIYGEQIEGVSNQLNEEFAYRAGNGAHYSKHKLIELVPNEKIVWLVTDSHLSFITDHAEWTGTKMSFNLTPTEEGTLVTFQHEGLVPEIACYDACSNGWSAYLSILENHLRKP